MSSNEPLLTAQDVDPVEVHQALQPFPILLVCDHAGAAVPQKLMHNMPSADDMARHIAIDVGARQLAITIARQLAATLVLQRYSRLVIDMNRPTDSHELCPAVSDETVIGFNQNLTADDRRARISEIFTVYHNRIAAILDADDHPPAALLAIHSFTPQLRNQAPRSWHVDLISRSSTNIALKVQQALQHQQPQLSIGVNAIFKVSEKSDYTLRTHGEARSLPCLSIEVRNDLLCDHNEITRWGKMLADIVPRAFADDIHYG